MDKILKKILQNKRNVSVREFETLLKHFGFEKIRHKGSHACYFNSKKQKKFFFPHSRPVKECYIINFLRIIKYEV